MKGIKLQLLGLGIIGTAIALAMDIFIGFCGELVFYQLQ